MLGCLCHVRYTMKEGKRTVLIFPPHRLGRQMVERISFLFGRPTICLPWQMELPYENGGAADQEFFDIARPPREMMPPEHFSRLLAEYRAWVKDNPDRSRWAFLGAAREFYPQEDNRWEIQQMVRKGAGHGDTHGREALALKRHLLLHLAAAMEKETDDAEEALRRLKKQDSPLKAVLDEDPEGPGFMDDLSPSLSQPIFESDRMGDICEAWLGLFETRIKEAPLLVTLDEKIQGYVRELFEEAASAVDLIYPLPTIYFQVPDPFTLSSEGLGNAGIHELQKSVMLLISEMIKALLEGKGGNTDEMNVLTKEMNSKFPARGSTTLIRVEILSLPVVKAPHSVQKPAILNGLEGKALALVRKFSKDG